MSNEQAPEYRVLARKYRPQNFDELIGQEPLVRTLTNAIESGRIAHAFMLTGVRGVGKTTTARIIAKSLNYAGADGTSGPTTGDTSDCETARAISEGRHPDVIEMDAASNTGVDDIREIIDSVNYAPASARYKVYIIDEVHMLSKNAFNALLKTLEEPPAHVKFIFATTEIRKVPITVLSRCQRFDLRRIELADLEQHFSKICEEEKVDFEDSAISLIARAADGSVRDGLSILDQAIALSDTKTGAKVEEALVKDMLGLADKSRIMDLFDHAISGQSDAALEILSSLHSNGADPVSVLEDLLSLTHALTKLKLSKGENAETLDLPKAETVRATELSFGLSMPSLNKAWQILMKGLSEVQSAPMAQSALEMVIIRLIYAAQLPDPLDLIRKLEDGTLTTATNAAAVQTSTQAPTQQDSAPNSQTHFKVHQGSGVQNTQAQALKQEPVPEESPISSPENLRDVYELCRQVGEIKLAVEVYHMAHLVSMKKGQIEIRINENAPADFTQRLTKTLYESTGNRWLISIAKQGGAPSLAEEEEAQKQKRLEQIKATPIVRDILNAFPGAEISDIGT